MFKKSYSVDGELAVLGRHHTIAKTLARHLGKHAAEYEEKFFHELWNGILSPASPALANTGTKRGMVVSCSAKSLATRCMTSIPHYVKLQSSASTGFGTSGDFSSI